MAQVSKRILLVEDDMEMRHIFDELLHDIDSNIDMDWVTTAEAALKRIEEASHCSGAIPYDLLVSDIFLEGKSTGIDLWKLCQKVYPTMPIVVMSALPLPKFFDFIENKSLRPIFIQKPLRIPLCNKILQEILAAN